MKRLSLLCLAFLVLAVGLAPAQEPAAAVDKDAQLKAAFMKIMQAGPMPQVDRDRWRSDAAYRNEMTAKRNAAIEARKKAAGIFLKEHAADTKNGVGNLYRARAHMILGQMKEAIPAYEAFRAQVAEHDDRAVASFELLRCYVNATDNVAAAQKLGVELKAANLPGRLGQVVAREVDGVESWAKRMSLMGKPLPEFTVTDTVGAPEGFSMAGLKGKVVVIDFWATWCPPCRAIIPELVRLQEKHKDAGLALIGLTTYYGSGWQFTGRDGDRLKGVNVGGRGNQIDKAAEKELNVAFHKGVPLNYPIVFTERNVGSETFGVRGIPTLFVVDRKGNVRWHKVGAGADGKKKLVEWVEKLLAEK